MKQCDDDLRMKVIRLEERLKASDTALVLANENINITARAMEKRLEGMNEFRDTLKDQTATFITRIEFDKTVSFQNKIIGAIALVAFLIPIVVAVFIKVH